MPSSGNVSGAVAMTLGPLRTAYTPNLGGLSIVAGARKGFREDGALPGVIGGIAGAGRLDFSVLAPVLVALGEAEANPLLTQAAAQFAILPFERFESLTVIRHLPVR